MYSKKVIGLFVSPNCFPTPVLYNEESETGNYRNYISTFNGRMIHEKGEIFPFSKDNLKIYSEILKLKEEDLNELNQENIYEHFKNEFKKNYPNVENFEISTVSMFIKNKEFEKTYKNLSELIPECKESKTKRTPEELEDLKSKLIEKYSKFKIIPYSSNLVNPSNYQDRFMIENEYIHIVNFLDELELRGNTKEFYKKSFSGLIYDETYSKKIIDVNSFLEYANNIDGLLDSIEQVFSNKKFKNLEKETEKLLNKNYALYELSLLNFEIEKTDDFPIKVNIILKNSIVQNCIENTLDTKELNKIINIDNNICGYYEIYNKDEVYLKNNKKYILNEGTLNLDDILSNEYLFENILEKLIENQKPYKSLDFVTTKLLDIIDNLDTKECKVFINDKKITSKSKLEKFLNNYEEVDDLGEFNVIIKTSIDTFRIWSECFPYVMVEDLEDGELYTGIPQLNKNHFEKELNSLIDYHTRRFIINKENDSNSIDR